MSKSILLALLLAACGEPPAYDVTIAPDAKLKPYVAEAVEAWGVGSVGPSRNTASVVPPTSEWLTASEEQPEALLGATYGLTDGDERLARMYVVEGLDERLLRRTVAHEVGHLLRWQLCGLGGHLPCGNVMAARESCQAEELTAADIAYVFDCTEGEGAL